MEENTPSEKTEKRGPGQPKALIDWKKVDDLLMAGCFGAGIAHYLGINPATLYSRCEIDKGIPFSEYSQQKKEKGDEILRAHQYAKALGLTDKGDNTLLIWLGKTRLKQAEYKPEITNDAQAHESLNRLMTFLSKTQSSSDNDLSKSKTESTS